MSPIPTPTQPPIPCAPATGTTVPLAWADPQRKALFEAWLVRLQGPHRLAPATLRLASLPASMATATADSVPVRPMKARREAMEVGLTRV